VQYKFEIKVEADATFFQDRTNNKVSFKQSKQAKLK